MSFRNSSAIQPIREWENNITFPTKTQAPAEFISFQTERIDALRHRPEPETAAHLFKLYADKVKGLDNPLRRRCETKDGDAAGGIIRNLKESVWIVRRILPKRTAAMMIDAVFK